MNREVTGSNNTTIRAFVAITLPESIRTFLRELQARLKKKKVINGSWPDPSTMHLTLVFLGDIPFSCVPAVQQRMAAAIAEYKQTKLAFEDPPQKEGQLFSLSVGGIGFFPSAKNIRVLWTGVRGQTDRLETLYSLFTNQMNDAGFKMDQKRFTPHITLVRIKNPVSGNPIFSAVKECEGLVSDDFTVKSIELFKSRLTSSGAIHTTLISEKI